MSPLKFLLFAAVLLLAIVAGPAAILIERKRAPAQAAWRNPAVRDALMAVAGWASLFVLDLAVELAGGTALPAELRHLLGTLALLLLYYAVLATLRLIYRSLRRIHARMRMGAGYAPRPIPLVGRLMFPTLFVSAALAALSVLWFDGWTRNLAFIVAIAVLLGLIRRTRSPAAAPAPPASL